MIAISWRCEWHWLWTWRWKWCSTSAATCTAGLGPASPLTSLHLKFLACKRQDSGMWLVRSSHLLFWPVRLMAFLSSLWEYARLFVCLLWFREGLLLIGGALRKALISKEKRRSVMQCLSSCIPHPPACPSILLIRVNTGWHLEDRLLFWPLFIDILSLLKSFLEQIKG